MAYLCITKPTISNPIQMKKLLLCLSGCIIACNLVFVQESKSCTSAIVGPGLSKNSHAMLWKHRDTGTEHNFIDRVSGNGHLSYIALFNGGDSLRREAWMGMNEAGFAIMNTASYNLMPDTATFKDQEGEVMRMALERCRTIKDFTNLLDTLPKPMGVQANFGVIDMTGAGGYFETDDYKYTPFLLNDSADLIIRTNFSFTGNDEDGMGYIRYNTATKLLSEIIVDKKLCPADFTENLSRSFYHSLYGKDIAADTSFHYIVDQDFIPRKISSASIVIESDSTPEGYVMWTVLGYPPVSNVVPATIDFVPECLLPIEDGLRAKACNEAIERKRQVFDIKRGSGPKYVNMDYVREQNELQRKKSMETYDNFYSDRIVKKKH